MCGKAFDPRLIVAWPGSKMAVMGGEQAAKVLLQIEKNKLKKEGEKIDPKKEKILHQEIKSRYEEQTRAYYAAARLWTDAIIDPVDTRQWISTGIKAANHAPIERQFNMGLLQV
jgi:3-methylcrotonyl-CoA carboxylase beta subunit